MDATQHHPETQLLVGVNRADGCAELLRREGHLQLIQRVHVGLLEDLQGLRRVGDFVQQLHQVGVVLDHMLRRVLADGLGFTDRLPGVLINRLELVFLQLGEVAGLGDRQHLILDLLVGLVDVRLR
ncbi:hypothetical protein D3C72_1697950 [compost metagenome]